MFQQIQICLTQVFLNWHPGNTTTTTGKSISNLNTQNQNFGQIGNHTMEPLMGPGEAVEWKNQLKNLMRLAHYCSDTDCR